MNNLKEAYVDRSPDGTLWVRCPHCNHKLFQLNETTMIRNLTYKCKGSNCKQLMRINVEP